MLHPPLAKGSIFKGQRWSNWSGGIQLARCLYICVSKPDLITRQSKTDRKKNHKLLKHFPRLPWPSVTEMGMNMKAKLSVAIPKANTRPLEWQVANPTTQNLQWPDPRIRLSITATPQTQLLATATTRVSPHWLAISKPLFPTMEWAQAPTWLGPMALLLLLLATMANTMDPMGRLLTGGSWSAETASAP